MNTTKNPVKLRFLQNYIKRNNGQLTTADLVHDMKLDPATRYISISKVEVENLLNGERGIEKNKHGKWVFIEVNTSVYASVVQETPNKLTHKPAPATSLFRTALKRDMVPQNLSAEMIIEVIDHFAMRTSLIAVELEKKLNIRYTRELVDNLLQGDSRFIKDSLDRWHFAESENQKAWVRMRDRERWK